MKPSLRATLVLCLCLLVGPSLLDAQTISFEVLAEFGYPGAHATFAYGINDAGDVVGSILLDMVDYANGFERYADGSVSMPIVFPGSGVRDTVATAINNEGTLAGWYADSTGTPHGFFLSQGVFTSYDHPDAVSTRINGINDAGDFVGTYTQTGGIQHNFASIGGELSEIIIPRTTTVAQPTDINNRGAIVGWAEGSTGGGGFRLESSGRHRYPLQRESGIFDHFFGTNETRASVGQENFSDGLYYGGGTTYVIYNFPGLINNALTGINQQGVICGYGFDSSQLILYSYLVQRVISRTAE